jgi:Sec-independent protein translocase protein TatA
VTRFIAVPLPLACVAVVVVALMNDARLSRITKRAVKVSRIFRKAIRDHKRNHVSSTGVDNDLEEWARAGAHAVLQQASTHCRPEDAQNR